MKSSLLALPIVLLLFAFTYPGKDKSPLDKFSPPGTVRVDDRLWFDETELTNFSWLEYISYVKRHQGDSSEAYLACLPDTNVWTQEGGYLAPMAEHYFDHPAYKDYPVVGITHEQAIAYCEWRTDRVREFMEIVQQSKPNYYIPKNFRYRLPTNEEWEAMAAIGYTDQTSKKLQRPKYLNTCRYNFADSKSNSSVGQDEAFLTAPTYSYWPNAKGIYNLFGNVSEMIDRPGIAKGGSFRDQQDAFATETVVSYEGPKQWLGFRCVCEVIEE